jgi:hypothetical protein
MADAKA